MLNFLLVEIKFCNDEKKIKRLAALFEVLSLLFFLFLALSDSRSLSWIAVNGKSSILAYHPNPLNPISRFGRNFNLMKFSNIFEHIFFRYKTKPSMKYRFFFLRFFFILTFKVFFP